MKAEENAEKDRERQFQEVDGANAFSSCSNSLPAYVTKICKIIQQKILLDIHLMAVEECPKFVFNSECMELCHFFCFGFALGEIAKALNANSSWYVRSKNELKSTALHRLQWYSQFSLHSFSKIEDDDGG